jgi:hypothetical protein
MTPLAQREIEVNNVIVADGCIDLLVDFVQRRYHAHVPRKLNSIRN